MDVEIKPIVDSKLNNSQEFLSFFDNLFEFYFCIDDVSSSTTDATPNEQEPQDQAVPCDVETLKLGSIRPDTSEAESLVTPGPTLAVNELPISGQTIPDRDSSVSDVTPVRDANVRLQWGVDDKIPVDSASKEAEPSPETTGMDLVRTFIL